MEQTTDEITIDGNRFISVKRAAGLSEYTADYIGQLCRGGKLEATRIGRNWYVEEASLISHKQSQIDGTADEDAVEKAISPEFKKQNIFKGSFIVYHEDKRPLFPELTDKTPKFAKIEMPIDNEDLVVPNSIFTKTKSSLVEAARYSRDLFALPRKMAILFVSAAVCLGLFTLNVPYVTDLLKSGAGNLAGAVAETEFAGTVENEILVPYEYVARTINDLVDETVYSLLYGDIIKTE